MTTEQLSKNIVIFLALLHCPVDVLLLAYYNYASQIASKFPAQSNAPLLVSEQKFVNSLCSMHFLQALYLATFGSTNLTETV